MAQKYALVVGCNYPDTDYELNGCINDSISMRDVLINRLGFDRDYVEWLADGPDSECEPTAYYIKEYLNDILSMAEVGDVVFFYFAGHGTIIPGRASSTGRDEQAIVTSDDNFITSIDFRRILDGAPDGVEFVIMADSCHSGGLINHEQEQIGPQHPPRSRGYQVNRPRSIPFEVVLRRHLLHDHIDDHDHIRGHFIRMFGPEASLVFQSDPPRERFRPDQGILLSGCQPNELCGETEYHGRPHGVFTSAVLHILRKYRGHITNRELVQKARRYLRKKNIVTQHPCLYSSNEHVDALFLE